MTSTSTSKQIGKVALTPAGNWDNTNEYEKLDVVYYQGGSYVAKKAVPVATNITNGEYWQALAEKAPSLTIGTVSTVSAETGASASIGGTADEPTLNFSIPRGVAGNESIDDTAGKGDTDKVWSADRSYAVQESCETFRSVISEVPYEKKYFTTGITLESTNAQRTNSNTLKLSSAEGYSVVKVQVTVDKIFRISSYANNSLNYGAGFYCVDSSNNILIAHMKIVIIKSYVYILDTVEIEVPEGTAYIYVNATEARPCIVEKVLYQIADNRLLEHSEEPVKSYKYLHATIYYKGIYQTDGDTVKYVGGNDGYNTIEYELNGETKLRAYCAYTNNSSYGVGYYCLDSNREILSYKINDVSGVVVGYVEFDVPEGTAYVIANNYGRSFVPTLEEVIESDSGYIPKFYTKEESNQRYYTKEESNQEFYTKEDSDLRYIRKNPFSMSMFKKIAVIGDSYSSGCVYNRDDSSGGSDNYDISWIQNIARRCGNTAINFSHGGYTAEGWIVGSEGLSKLNASDPQDLYIISLGINDVYRNASTSGFCENSETLIENKTRGTMCGNLAVIVDAILTKNPSAKIVFLQQCNLWVTNSTFKHYYDLINSNIAFVANYYGVPYLSENDNEYFKSSFFDENKVESHPTAVNYVGMSIAIQNMIESILGTEYFNNYPY